jgi:hypothetical protein
MFVINNPKGTHLWLFKKKFSKKYSSSVWYIQITEREIWPSLPKSRIYIVVLLCKSLPRWSQFLFLRHIFLFSTKCDTWNSICSLLQVFFKLLLVLFLCLLKIVYYCLRGINAFVVFLCIVLHFCTWK